MNKNICRPIVLFNNFVPPYSGRQDWEYEALGYYDGISVGDNIVQDKFELKDIWKKSAGYAKALEGKYTAQVMYIFRCETGKEIIKDENFWQDRTENDQYPYLFVSLLRLNSSIEHLAEIKQKLEKKVNKEGVMLITYLSLDNNDLVVITRSREYQHGLRIIDQFHQIKKDKSEHVRTILYDSFSVAGIRKKCINSPEYLFWDRDKAVDKVCLRIIEKEPGSIQRLKNKLKEKLNVVDIQSYPVLGCEDELVILDSVVLGEFWKLYKDVQGVLANSNDVYQTAVMGITSLVLHDTENEAGNLMESESNEKNIKIKSMCGMLREQCLSFYQGYADHFDGNGKMYLKAILQIINSLQKYETMEYIDYTYIALYEPMKMLVKLIGEAKERGNKKVFDDISQFFNAVNLLTQNSIRLERQFIQSVDLNARIYEAPVQLSIFYTAYFALLRDILNKNMNEKHEYEFMICPGMMEYLNVQKLLPDISRTKRLLLVEIPENQMYDMKKLLVIMVHEAAHFVGRDIRQRKERYDFMLEAIAKSLGTFLVLDPDMHPYCTEKTVKKFQEDYLKLLKEEADRYCKEIERHSKGEREKEDRYHTENMKYDLQTTAQSVLIGALELLDVIGGEAFYAKYGESYVSPEIMVENRYEFKEEFSCVKIAFVNRMIIPAFTLSDEPCISNIVDNNIHLFKESFADLMAILLLNLEEREYFEALFRSVREPLNSYSTVMWRMALVIKVMCRKSSDYTEFQWSEETFEKMLRSSSVQNEQQFLQRILQIIKQYLSGKKSIFDIYEEISTSDKPYRNLDRMFNYEVGDIFCKYLSICFDKFQENVEQGVYKDGKLNELREMYQHLKEIGDLEEYIYCIRKAIEKYAKNFYD